MTSVDLTGDPLADILGTYGGWGRDSQVLFDFLPDGILRNIEAPNMYRPGGSEAEGAWEIDADLLMIDIGGGPNTLLYEIGADALTISAAPEGTAGLMVGPHSRVTCAGFGF